MLLQITWTQYFGYTLLALAIYYITCFAFFGKNFLSGYLKISKAGNTQRIWGVTEQPQEQFEISSTPGLVATTKTSGLREFDNSPVVFEEKSEQKTLYPLVHDLVNEIETLLKAKGKHADKSEMLQELSTVVEKYPALRITEFQNSINYLIAVTCQNYCAITLNETEIKDLWG